MNHYLRKIVMPVLLLLIVSAVKAQEGAVGVGTNQPDPSAILEVKAKGKGVLLPQINLQSVTDQATIANPAQSLLVFNTNANIQGGNGMGFYYWSGSTGTPANQWIFVGSGSSSSASAMIYTGTGLPAGTLGKAGDLYMDNATGNYYQKDAAGNWNLQGNLKGPKGDVGLAGGTGAPGAKGQPGYPGEGVSIYTDNSTGDVYVQNADGTWTKINGKDGTVGVAGGNGVPGNQGQPGYPGTGVNIYTDKTTNIVYVQNADGTWTPITGAKGDKGDTGIAGIEGGKGIPGAPGSTTISSTTNLYLDSSTQIIYMRDPNDPTNWVPTDKVVKKDMKGDNFIVVAGGDSSVLNNVNLTLDTKKLASDSLFIATQVTNNQFKDSITNLVVNNPTINNNVTNIVRDSVTNWYTNNTTLRDSIINTVKVNADTLTGDKFIKVLGGDGATLV